jgi:short-subunit dehydrogenase
MSHDAFTNKSIVITGASQGIGRETALLLAEQGAFLTLAARNTDLLAETAALCEKKGGKALPVTADISKEDQSRELIRRAYEEYGHIDVLINNAGAVDKSLFENLSGFASGETVMQVNFWGSVYCTYYALPYLKETKGRIVVIISGAGKFVTPTSIFYGASKHALDGFCDTLRYELRAAGVTVTAIYPDWVATGISTRALGSDGKPTGKLSYRENSAMRADKCAKAIVKAAEKRRRTVLISGRQRIAYTLRPLLPKLTDHIVGKFFE